MRRRTRDLIELVDLQLVEIQLQLQLIIDMADQLIRLTRERNNENA